MAKKKFILNGGHGYSTAGKRSPDGMREYEFNRAVANYAKEMFLERYQDVEIYFPHSDERDVPLKERTDYANRLGVDAYISVHANAYGDGRTFNSANGVEVFVYKTKPKEAYEFAKIVQKNLVADTGLRDRDVKTADFHELRETNMTAILLEAGFMTNEKEAALLKSEAYRKKVAEVIVKSTAEFYDLKEKPKPEPQPKPKPQEKPSTIYRVQVGAFGVKANADNLEKELERKGFDAFVKLVDGLYKVQVGAYGVKDNAVKQKERLEKLGYKPFITTK